MSNSFSSLDSNHQAPKTADTPRFLCLAYPLSSLSLSQSLFTDERPLPQATHPSCPSPPELLCLPLWYLLSHVWSYTLCLLSSLLLHASQFLLTTALPNRHTLSFGFGSAIHGVPCRINVSSIFCNSLPLGPTSFLGVFGPSCHFKAVTLILLQLSSPKWTHIPASRFPQAHQMDFAIICPRSATFRTFGSSSSPPNQLLPGFNPCEAACPVPLFWT